MVLIKQPPQWPPQSECELGEIQIEFGRILMSITPDCRLKACIVCEQTITYGEFIADRSPIILTESFDFQKKIAALLISFTGKIINYVQIDGKVIWGEISTILASIPSPPSLDFSDANRIARDLRERQLRGILSTQLRDHPGAAYDFKSLINERNQILDLVELVDNLKKFDHVNGLLSRIRACIYEKPRRLSLMQMCAAHINSDVIFTTRFDYITTNKDSFSAVQFFNSLDTPLGIFQPDGSTFIDLDVWLDQVGVIIKGKSYSIREVVQAWGNRLGGHRIAFPNILVEYMEMRPQLPGPLAHNTIAKSAINIGLLIVHLADMLTKRYAETR